MKSLIYILFLVLLLSGCGTTTGNALVQSDSFNTTGSTFLRLGQQLLAVSAITNVSTLRFCVTKIQLQDDNDTFKKKDNDSEISFSPGLIDLSSGAAMDWGHPDIPVDFTLKRIYVVVRKDPVLCTGTNYAFKFNGYSTESSITMKWRLNPPVDITNDDIFTLSLSQIVAALRNAADANTLSNNNLKNTVESTEDSAQRTHKH
jgi:hypothetical protein